MSINNFKQIKELLKFNSSDEFYFLQILQRKKDHKEGQKVNGTNNNSRLIKAYYVKSLEQFDFIEGEVIALCDLFNARAGINLNKRSFEKTALQHLKLVTDNIINKNYDKVYKTYSSAAGKFTHDSQKKWVVDVDKDEVVWVEQIIDAIYECEPVGSKYIATIPSKTGLHIITSPFNRSQFKDKLNVELKKYQMMDTILIEIQSNNPTNLYIP